MHSNCYGRKILHSLSTTLPSSFFITFMDEQMSYIMEYPFINRSAVLAVSFPKIMPSSSLLGKGKVGETDLMQWSTAQQQPKLWGVSHTFLATNANNSFVRALMEKITSTTWPRAQVPPVITPNVSSWHFLLVPAIYQTILTKCGDKPPLPMKPSACNTSSSKSLLQISSIPKTVSPWITL